MARPPHDGVLRRIDDDLVIRRAGPDDVDAVVALNVSVFGPQEASSVPALMTGPLGVEWLVVATDDGTGSGGGAIAAACARIPRAFVLDGVSVVGSQIENVTTDERYRRRGLVRALFDVHHRRAAEAGELLQVIGGIPYFYRKLGYGYGFDVAPTLSIGAPGPAPGGDTAVTVRPASADDVGWMLEAEQSRPRAGFTVERHQAVFATWMARTAEKDGLAWEAMWVAERHGRPEGWARTMAWADERQLFVLPGEASDLDVATQLLARAMGVAQELADRTGHPFEVLASDLPGSPWSRAIHAAGRIRPEPSAYYARTADEVALLRALEPALSARVAASGLAHDRGELLISLYDRGITLAWGDGRITSIEPASPDPDPFDHGGVGVAPDWFPALVLGRWGASGLAARTDDTLLGDHTAVMDVLFPARPNEVVVDL